MTKKLVMTGVKRKGESIFTKTYSSGEIIKNTGKDVFIVDEFAFLKKNPAVIHNGTGIKRCSVCASIIPSGQCACINCGSDNT